MPVQVCSPNTYYCIAIFVLQAYKFIASRKQDELDCDDVDVFGDEESCIELEFTFPEEEEAEDEDTITIVSADDVVEEVVEEAVEETTEEA